jgi:hypothetical protein
VNKVVTTDGKETKRKCKSTTKIALIMELIRKSLRRRPRQSQLLTLSELIFFMNSLSGVPNISIIKLSWWMSDGGKICAKL